MLDSMEASLLKANGSSKTLADIVSFADVKKAKAGCESFADIATGL
jgi:hypothetical protein